MKPPPFDPRRSIHGIRAFIRIQTPPFYDPVSGQIRPGEMWGFDSATPDPAAHLLSLTLSKHLAEPCGRFSMQLTPQHPWAELIPGYSLVEIWLQRYPENPAPVLAMLGLTRGDLVAEDYSRAEPERTIQISGSELSTIFVDQRVLYLPVPPKELNPRQAPVLPTTAGQQLAVLKSVGYGMLAIDPQLAMVGASPVDAINNFMLMVTRGVTTEYNTDGRPLLTFDFPDATLAELLFFDREKAVAALFDPSAQLPAAAQLSGDSSSLWNLMSTWCDRTYQELFTRSVPTAGNPAVEVVFRKKPFAGRIDANGAVTGIADIKGPQFDREFVETETVTIDDRNVLATSLTRSVEMARNVYLVYPVVPGFNGVDFRSIHTPLLDGQRYAPSSALRLGPRLMEVSDYYLRLPESPNDPCPDAYSIAEAREHLLWGWHRFEPCFQRGRYTLRGDTRMQVGKRLLDVRRDSATEFYITGVAHSLSFGSAAPSFTTAVDVERGWPVA